MSLMDEFKAERESIKQASLKKKLEYFWDYYKWHTIGAFFVLIAIGMFMYTASKSTETIFYAIFFNTDLSKTKTAINTIPKTSSTESIFATTRRDNINNIK